MPTAFLELAEIGERLESTRKRSAMIDFVSEFLRRLGDEETEAAVSMLVGKPLSDWSPNALEVSWATLSAVLRKTSGVDSRRFGEAFSQAVDVGSAAKLLFEKRVRKQAVLLENELTILGVWQGLKAIAESFGHGSRERKEHLVEALLNQASSLEAKYLVKILIGEMRTGFQEGLMEQAISKAFDVPLESVHRASMIRGDIGEVASIARKTGSVGPSEIRFELFRPARPMLAQNVDTVTDALRVHGGESALEYKYDGARVQIHKQDEKVKIFSRRLTDVTGSLPEIAERVQKNVDAAEVILEGEVVAVDACGFPIPFQHLMRRFRRVHGIQSISARIPLKLFLFDVLYLNGQSLIDTTYTSRRQILFENKGEISLTSSIITSSVADAEAFLKSAMDGGHEGLMAKKPDSPYTPGIRGKRWLKIKPVLETLDLVISAAEWGYGRRHGWLSDYYLAARDTETGRFIDVGKTFKGLADEEIIEITKRLKQSVIKHESHRVVVVPKIVVEVAYNEIQRSPKYDCGMTLRFARIRRIRDDKAPEEADTIQRVEEIYQRQFKKKSRYTSYPQQTNS